MPELTGSPRRPIEVPSSTYRVQLGADFGFSQLADQLDHIDALGVSHVYLSPILEAAPGSTHGYDVVDHGRVSTALGGGEALRALARRAADRGMGLIADVVPNHMGVPVPLWHNAQLWSVLRDGPGSPFAAWFDINWSVPEHAVVLPVLADPIETTLDDGALTTERDGDDTVLRYGDNVFPVRAGTEGLPFEELLARQWYRLAWWRVGDEQINYRRFFNIDSLVALRVEDPAVFAATHALLVDLVHEGVLSGLRIDHPDGLAEPARYFEHLEQVVPGRWTVAEKVLARDERLPQWRCDGTTGYEVAAALDGLFTSADGYARLTIDHAKRTGAAVDFQDVVHEAKREVLTTSLRAELERNVELAEQYCGEHTRTRDHTATALRRCLTELAVHLPQYRAYVRPGSVVAGEREPLDAAAELAALVLEEHELRTLELLVAVLAQPNPADPIAVEFCTRFQQLCSAAAAKGVEDRAFYRWSPSGAPNEVGGDPARPSWGADEVHDFAAHLQQRWPSTMTSGSTHDSKRGEDTRARLVAASHDPEGWQHLLATRHQRLEELVANAGIEPIDEEFLWQGIVGLWSTDGRPPDKGRVRDYLLKAVREAAGRTSWTAPDEPYEAALSAAVDAALDDDDTLAATGAFVDAQHGAWRMIVLGRKLLQLTFPGVADVYQGSERVWLALVDPDNRRAIDFDALRATLRSADQPARPPGLDVEKVFVTATALRLRRRRPEWFGVDATYEPVLTSNAAVFGYVRSGSVAVLTQRRPGPLPDDTTAVLPAGRWWNLLEPAVVESDGTPESVQGLLSQLPVALLERDRAEQ